MSAFFSKDIVILDVTSRLISAIVGCKKAQSVYDIKASAEREYDGFCDGQWLNEADLHSVVSEVLSEAVAAAGSRSRRIFIGVPGEFVSVVNKRVFVTLDRVRRVIDADIDFLLRKGNDFDDDGYEVINSSAVCYSVDTSDKLYFDVRGMMAGRIEATVSYMFCETRFTDTFRTIAAEHGFKEIHFIASPWAEGLALFEREQRDVSYVLVDIGYISSFIAVGRGEGLCELKSFSLGGAHIAADMYEYLQVPFELAERAKELVDLNLSYADDAVLVADNDYTVFAADACEIVRARLEQFAELIKTVLDGLDSPTYVPVYLTGEGVASIRGAKKFLSEQLNRSVEVCAPRLPGFSKPSDSSKISLLTVAETLSKFNFGEYIKRVLNGGKI